MKSFKVLFLVLVLLTLTGCVGAEKVTLEAATETSALESLPTDTVAATPKQEITPEVEETPQDEMENTTSEATPVSGALTASECTLVSSLPDAPEEYAELFSVQEDDWVIGPDDAAITLIEYGDFQ